MRYIDDSPISGKKVLMRVDFNVPLTPEKTIANDERIKQTLPTIQSLLKNGNKLILMSHLGNPKSPDPAFSLAPVAQHLQKLLPEYTIKLVTDYNHGTLDQSNNEILLLENLRFHPGEKKNDPEFARQLASLAEVYVNDAFGSCHRAHASVVGVAELLPHYGGLLVKREVMMLSKILKNPEKPFVAILGGAKISSKVKLIGVFVNLADTVILGGGLVHNVMLAQGMEIGKSISEKEMLEETKALMEQATSKGTKLLMPVDARVGDMNNPEEKGTIKAIKDIQPDDVILDIGPETEKIYAAAIAEAKTVVWNGPTGLFEHPSFRSGTDAVYNAIIANTAVTSILGGGDTLSAIANKTDKNKLTHISTGGGAMLEFVENGTLPGIEALK